MAEGGQRFYTEEEAEQILSLATKRTLNPDRLTRDRLLAAAAELGLSPEDVQAAEHELSQKDTDLADRKAYHYHLRQEFLQHVATYLFVNVFLTVVNLMTNPHKLWVVWVLLCWGLGMAFHAYSTFFARGTEYEREYQRWVRRRNKRLAKQTETST